MSIGSALLNATGSQRASSDAFARWAQAVVRGDPTPVVVGLFRFTGMPISTLGKWMQDLSVSGAAVGVVDKLRAAGGELQMSSPVGKWTERVALANDL